MTREEARTALLVNGMVCALMAPVDEDFADRVAVLRTALAGDPLEPVTGTGMAPAVFRLKIAAGRLVESWDVGAWVRGEAGWYRARHEATVALQAVCTLRVVGLLKALEQ